MLSPPSPQQFSRLERILELVTEHERVYREQVCVCVHLHCLQCLHATAAAGCRGAKDDTCCCRCLQDIRLADLVRKVTELDVRCTAETAPLLPLKVRPSAAAPCPLTAGQPLTSPRALLP